MIYKNRYYYLYFKPCALRKNFKWMNPEGCMDSYAGTIQTNDPKYNKRNLYSEYRFDEWGWNREAYITIKSQKDLNFYLQYAKNKDIIKQIDEGIIP